MSISQAQSQMLMHALSMAAQVAGNRLQAETSRQELSVSLARIEFEQGIFSAKAALLRDLITALIEKRIDVVHAGFSEVMTLYAEQARHYMAQQAKVADAELVTRDALQSARFRKRIGEIDIELRGIRAAAAQLYAQMNEVVLRLGGEGFVIAPDITTALALGQVKG